MKVLPPAPPAPHDATSPPRHEADDGAPTGFGALLAGQVAAHGAAPQASEAPADPGDEPDDTTDDPSVAAAVHAAIAAWRADPGGVALGRHLRTVLHETVTASTAPQVVPGGDAQGTQPDGTIVQPATVPTVGEAATSEVAPTVDTAPANPLAAATVDASDQEATAPEDLQDLPAPAQDASPSSPAGTSSSRPVTAVTPADPATPATPADPATSADPATPAVPAEPATAPTATATAPTGAAPAVDAPGSPASADPRPRTHRVEPAPPDDRPDVAAAHVGREGAPRPNGASVPRVGHTSVSAATIDRVLRAAEALEHAPPPRHVAVEVEGVQLSVALRGHEISVTVRAGADQLAPGWQRDLAAALGDRGLGLAADGGGGAASRDGHGPGHHGPRPDRTAPPHPGTPPSRSRRPADPADLRL